MLKKLKYICKIILLMLIIISIMHPTFAVERKDKSDLEISFIAENNTLPIEGAKIFIYNLATVGYEDFLVEWNELYSDYIIDLATVTDDEIVSMANELEIFVKENNIEPSHESATDANGQVNFSFENGVYLICGEEITKGNTIYTPNPSIILMPYTSEESALVYKASIELKYSMEKIPTKPTPPATQNPPAAQDPSDSSSENKGSILPPLTGDMIPVIVGIVIAIVILLNIIVQIILNKKKKKDEK